MTLADEQLDAIHAKRVATHEDAPFFTQLTLANRARVRILIASLSKTSHFQILQVQNVPHVPFQRLASHRQIAI